MDVLTEDVKKNVPGSMMFADDIIGPYYAVVTRQTRQSRLGYLDESIIGHTDEDQQTKNPIHVFKFWQDNGQGREPVKILVEEVQRVLSISVQAWRRQKAWYRNYTQSECSMEKLEEMQWSVV